jgi:hypothetical protein
MMLAEIFTSTPAVVNSRRTKETLVSDMSSALSVAQRLIDVLDHLGLPTVHFALRYPVDLVELLERAPERVAAVVLQGATSRPEPFASGATPTLWVLGDAGLSGQMRARLAALPHAVVHWLTDYPGFSWSDTAAGSGTPLVLFPLGLASQQWEPVLARLQAHHCTIVLGGKYLKPVELLEARAEGGYTRMALQLLDMAKPHAGEALIEVGCDTGALLRRIVRHTGMARVTGLDINGFLLQEARVRGGAGGLERASPVQAGVGGGPPLSRTTPLTSSTPVP